MPSCVVPTCKNHTDINKKSDGITFHVFPADERRKQVWVKIIQYERMDEYWKPSKSSVICSIHFDEKYYNKTEGGLKRLRKGAYPSKNLVSKNKSGVDNETAGPSATRTITQTASPITHSVIGLGVNIDDSEAHMDVADPRTSKTITDNQNHLFQPKSPTSDIGHVIVSDLETHIEIAGPTTSKTITQPLSPASPTDIGDETFSDLESIFDTPRKTKLKSQLRRQKLLQDKHVRKIKILQQKNRRLVKKNNSLKSVLRNLIKNRYVNQEEHNLL